MTAKYSYETRMFQQMNDNDGSVSYSPFIGAGAGLGLPPIESEQCFGTPRFGFCEYVTTDRTYDFSDVRYESQQAEINIISDFDGPLNYTVGYYMYDSRNDNEYRVQTPGTQYIGDFSSHPYYPTITGLLGIDFGAKGGVPFYQGLLGVVALATPATTAQTMLAMGMPISPVQQAILEAFGEGVAALRALPDVTVPLDIRGTLSDQHVRIKSQALYGELYYDLNDTTKLTVGLRFDDLTNAATTYNGGILSSGWIAAGGFLYDDRMKVPGLVDYLVQNETATNGKIAIQKYLQDDIMVYASYSTATKGAGVNAGDDPIPYDKEETAVLDFGLKARLLDGAMLLNMNLYRNDNEGMLLATIRDTQSFNNNVDAEITGFEGLMNVFLSETTQLEFSWLAVDAEITDAPATINYLNPWNANSVSQYLGPVDGAGTGFQTGAVMDNGTIGYKSAGFNCSSPFFAPAANVPCPTSLGASLGVPVSVAGLPLPGVADLSYSLSMTQIFPMNNGETSWRLSYRYRDEVNGDPFNYSRFDVPEQKSWDTLIRYTPSNGDWYVGVYAKNLNDDRTINSIRSGSNIQGGQLYANFTDPRTWGLQFGAEF
jgi:iron complex outermembrane receptor protein